MSIAKSIIAGKDSAQPCTSYDELSAQVTKLLWGMPVPMHEGAATFRDLMGVSSRYNNTKGDHLAYVRRDFFKSMDQLVSITINSCNAEIDCKSAYNHALTKYLEDAERFISAVKPVIEQEHEANRFDLKYPNLVGLDADKSFNIGTRSTLGAKLSAALKASGHELNAFSKAKGQAAS